MDEDRITRDDLEAELRAVVGDPEGAVAGRRPTLVVVAAVPVVVVVAVAVDAGYPSRPTQGRPRWSSSAPSQ